MPAYAKPVGTIWVCQDCMIADVNGEVPDDRDATQPEPWALEEFAMGEVTMGLMDDQHECGIPFDVGDRECGCEEREFSWSRCEGCGSILGGSRYAYTVWAD